MSYHREDPDTTNTSGDSNTSGRGRGGGTGTQGTTGNQGTQGTTGNQGTQGTTGNQGTRGNQGTTDSGTILSGELSMITNDNKLWEVKSVNNSTLLTQVQVGMNINLTSERNAYFGNDIVETLNLPLITLTNGIAGATYGASVDFEIDVSQRVTTNNDTNEDVEEQTPPADTEEESDTQDDRDDGGLGTEPGDDDRDDEEQGLGTEPGDDDRDDEEQTPPADTEEESDTDTQVNYATVELLKESQEIQFTDQSNRAENVTWDFGDGNTSTERNPIHTYTNNGVYTVVFTAFNQYGQSSSTDTVIIEGIGTETFIHQYEIEE